MGTRDPQRSDHDFSKPRKSRFPDMMEKIHYYSSDCFQLTFILLPRHPSCLVRAVEASSDTWRYSNGLTIRAT